MKIANKNVKMKISKKKNSKGPNTYACLTFVHKLFNRSWVVVLKELQSTRITTHIYLYIETKQAVASLAQHNCIPVTTQNNGIGPLLDHTMLKEESR